MVSLTVAIWNPIAEWLRCLERLETRCERLLLLPFRSDNLIFRRQRGNLGGDVTDELISAGRVRNRA